MGLRGEEPCIRLGLPAAHLQQGGAGKSNQARGGRFAVTGVGVHPAVSVMLELLR